MAKLHHTYRWQKLRARILKAEPLCRKCQRRAVEVDHVKPVSQGGAFFRRGNLQALCRACHEAKTAAEATKAPRFCGHGWPSDAGPCPDCAAVRS